MKLCMDVFSLKNKIKQAACLPVTWPIVDTELGTGPNLQPSSVTCQDCLFVSTSIHSTNID